MKALFIDTPNGTIQEIDFNGDYKDIQRLIKADYFTTVQFNSGGDTIFVDDEGLINGNPYGWFSIDGYHSPLKGYGLVLGTGPEGESVATTVTKAELYEMLRFPLHALFSGMEKELVEKTP